MDKQALLRSIWEDKRGKTVVGIESAIGLMLTVDSNTPITSHAVAHMILRTLAKNSQLAYEWSKNWGRTKVVVHPRYGFSASFTLKGSTEEKTAAKLITLPQLHPSRFINQDENSGAYLIILNASHKLSLEGCLLQIERLIDELVWVNFRAAYATKVGNTGSVDEVETYYEIVCDILNKGVQIEVASEDFILNLASKSHELKVRIYGDVNRTGTVPSVIGIARVGISQSEDTEPHVWPSVSSDFTAIQRTLTTDSHTGGTVVVVGATMGKRLHVGHALTLTVADIVRRIASCQSPLVIESDDISSRIDQTFALLAKRRKLDDTTTAMQAKEGLIPTEEILSAYQERDGIFIPQPDKTLWQLRRLSRLESDTEELLQASGFDVEVKPSSACLQIHGQVCAAIGQGWEELGFRYIRYEHGSYRGIIVLEQAGRPTASAMRAAVSLAGLKQHDVGTVVYVDADHSVRTGALIVELFDPTYRFTRIGGSGIGFYGKIGSGTKGNVPTVKQVYSQLGVSDRSLVGVLSTLMNTRWITEESLSTGDNLAFYDYRDGDSLLADLAAIKQEVAELCARIDVLREALENTASSNTALPDNRLIARLVKVSQQLIGDQLDYAMVFRMVEWKLEASIRNYRDWAKQGIHTLPKRDLDLTLIRVLCQQPATWEQFLEMMEEEGIVGHPRARQQHSPSTSLISLLTRTGYRTEEMPKVAARYLSGELTLKRRIALPWQFIEEMLNTDSEKLSNLQGVTKAILLDGLKAAVEILQLED